ncbi:Dyp-type peroxidase [Kribbella sp. NBC_00709]|uniref:Dyp-type peroxidase n=1 Tax=Kribbella sp. NBC_00709 TaxID=2975972 RepID=UPI002E2BC004|nr:Dyp-type peroxidase [Kribbella sp. NBC_00709]
MATDPTPDTSRATDALPQSVLMPLSGSAIFLVVRVDPGGEDRTRDLLERMSGLVRSVGFRVPGGNLSCVTSIGSDVWDRLFSGPRPAELHPFVELKGATHHAPSTPGDLLFHIRAAHQDQCFELAGQIMNVLDGAATVVDEVHGFKYFEMRDLLGFVDGTENPTGADAQAAVLVGDEDPDFQGGSYVIVQKYLHNLKAWNALTVEQQEQAVGRTKLDDIEFPDAKKPANAHIVLNVVEDEDGNQLQILRDNMPFGTIGAQEFGTYFIGYAKTPAVTELMLRRMFIGVPEGNHDRLLDFSTAATGCLFFTPTSDFLDDLPPAP